MINHSRVLVKVQAAILLVLLVAIILVSYLFLTKPCHGEYIIVFDAGSTGTRGLLYKHQNGVMVQTSKVTCGDSGIVQNIPPSNTYDTSHFTKCLQDLMKSDTKTKSYSVLLRATGGMRELCRQDEKSCKSTLKTLSSAAAALGFLLESDDFQVLNGEKEAYYLLRQATITFQNITSLIAVMDLGGVSAQVAHEKIESSYTIESRKKNRMSSNSESQSDYTFSSDCLGTSVSSMITERKLITSARQSNPSTNTVNHPCFPTGYSYRYKHTSGFTECRIPPLVGSTEDITFIGAFNAVQCKSLVTPEECAECKKWVLTQLLEQPTYNLYAVGAYSKSVDSISGYEDVSFSSYKTHVETFCAILSNDVSVRKKQKYCGGMMYSVSLIEKAGVDGHTFIVRENRNVGWINGFVDEYISTHSQCSTYLVIVTWMGIGLAVILILFFGCYWYSWPRSQNHGKV